MFHIGLAELYPIISRAILYSEKKMSVQATLLPRLIFLPVILGRSMRVLRVQRTAYSANMAACCHNPELFSSSSCSAK